MKADVAVAFALGFTLKALAGTPAMVTIDFPGAVFTDAVGVNAKGDIVGHYIDAKEADHGYLLRAGRFSTIDFPASSGGHAHDINSQGAIVGQFFRDEVGHGYLFTAGVFTNIDFPGATECRANGINNAGDIVGSYATGKDGAVRWRGFLRRGGVYTSIEFPGASFTEAWRINDSDQIIGRYLSDNGSCHIYRLTKSNFVTIDYPGSTNRTAVGDIYPVGGFNNHGDIVSGYCNASNCELETTEALHGFVLSKGVFTSLDIPRAAGTVAFGINDEGDIVGGYTDKSFRVHGFLKRARP